MKKYSLALILALMLVLQGCAPMEMVTELLVDTLVNMNVEEATTESVYEEWIVEDVTEVYYEEVETEVANFMYGNTKFGFGIEVPGFFTERQDAGNSEGVLFTSSDGEATLGVYGSYFPMVMGYEDVKTYYNDVKEDVEYDLTYSVCKDNWFVLTGYMGDDIVYSRYFLTDDFTEIVYTLKYPKERKEEFDDVIDLLTRTLVI